MLHSTYIIVINNFVLFPSIILSKENDIKSHPPAAYVKMEVFAPILYRIITQLRTRLTSLKNYPLRLWHKGRTVDQFLLYFVERRLDLVSCCCWTIHAHRLCWFIETISVVLNEVVGNLYPFVERFEAGFLNKVIVTRTRLLWMLWLCEKVFLNMLFIVWEFAK